MFIAKMSLNDRQTPEGWHMLQSIKKYLLLHFESRVLYDNSQILHHLGK
jgi:hypothetical protein